MQAWLLDATHARIVDHDMSNGARTGTQDMAGLFSLLQEGEVADGGEREGLAKAPGHGRSSPLP